MLYELLDKVASAHARLLEARNNTIRKSGPYTMGVTSKGGLYFQIQYKDGPTHDLIKQGSDADTVEIQVKQLQDLRDLIDCFLVEVVGVGTEGTNGQ